MVVEATATALAERLASANVSGGGSGSLLDLPNEVITRLFHHTSYQELVALALTCRRLNSLVLHYGWEAYLAANIRLSLGLSCVLGKWSPQQHVRYNVQADRNWRSKKFISRPLCPSWSRSYMPRLAILRHHLVLNAGPTVNIFDFCPMQSGPLAPSIFFKRSDCLQRSMEPSDITSVAPIVVDHEQDRLAFGHADGLIALAHIDECGKLVLGRTFQGEGTAVESLSATHGLLFALTISGKGILRNLNGIGSTEIWVDGKGRSSYMPNSGGAYVAVGSTSPMKPLSIHYIREAGLDLSPFAATIDPDRKGSPVYGITGAPSQFPCATDQVIVTGSYDGYVRLYDLRTPTDAQTSITGHASIPSLRPVLRLHDPLNNESIYCVASGGGSGYTVGAGLSRHSVVSFWDLRATRSGWSVYAPGNDPSPVFSLCIESSRVYGATQSRAFILDFSPQDSLSERTFPPVLSDRASMHRNRRLIDRALKWSDEMSCITTTYSHINPLS